MKFAYASGSRPLEGFTIKRGVGIGGFGEVYFATSDAGKEVALKRIQRNLDIELRGVRQCLNLKHPNLIGLYDIRYDDEGGAWVVMEYVAGESLKDVIERNPHGLPADQVLRDFGQIAAGVAYLHDHGIVHRDLKPGNIFLEDDTIKIGDYGLSKFISCSRRSGQTESVGTFHYMAPEIGKGVYGKEIDVYALGILLFEMLTGRVPFEGESSQEIMMKHLTADPDLDGVSQPFRSVIERCLYKDPDRRFQSVADLLQRLDGQSVSVVDAEAAEVLEAEPVCDIPPVVQPPRRPATSGAAPAGSGAAPAGRGAEPLYIGDEGAGESPDPGIVFGPVRERPPRRDRPAPPPTRLQSVPVAARGQEPVARAVRAGLSDVHHWWQHGRLGTPLKVLVLCAACFVLLINAEWLLPLAIFGGAAYLVYFGIRSLVLTVGDRRSPAGPVRGTAPGGRPAPAAAGTAAAARPVAGRRHVPVDQRVRQVLQHKPAAARIGELTGSWLMSALVAAVLSLIFLLLSGTSLHAGVGTWTLYAWLVLSSVAGSWFVLACGKSWEGSREDSVLRRFTMLTGGLLVGGLAFLGSRTLMVDLNDAPSVTMPVSLRLSEQLTSNMYAADGMPLLPAYLVYFGGLFLILRWWKQVDPLRSSRLSFWATANCALWAWILNMFWQFPQPWGFMLAMTIAISVQLAAPWIGSDERQRLAQRYREMPQDRIA